ncbi:hypothetical protein, partial [Vreelandella hamiltonii]|uniref:hypothetical protein n=1 Tax=Vreelandella hamiltonii TaxID=502829 RepID=UPI001E3C789E
VGHGTVWVNGDNGYIAMQVSGLEVLPGAGLTDSGCRHGDSRENFVKGVSNSKLKGLTIDVDGIEYTPTPKRRKRISRYRGNTP